ncbi:MAG: hypothetical protein PVI40_04870 [Chlamydiota bacterium]|jgi:hypothetical protein
MSSPTNNNSAPHRLVDSMLEDYQKERMPCDKFCESVKKTDQCAQDKFKDCVQECQSFKRLLIWHRKQ